MKDILKITVSFDERIVGTLQMTPERDRSVFEYDKDWIANGFSISPWELPLQTGLIYSKGNSFGGGFATYEDSMPDGYGLYLLDRMLRREGSSLEAISPLQRLSLVGSSGMGALCYKPEASKEHITAITDRDFDELQRKALNVLSEKSDADASFLYYNSRNSGGARPKAVYKAADGSDWIVKFRHIYDFSNIGKIEYQYMRTAQKCGIDIPEIRLINDRYFSIKRFDIKEGRRIHTLTAAALLQSGYSDICKPQQVFGPAGQRRRTTEQSSVILKILKRISDAAMRIIFLGVFRKTTSAYPVFGFYFHRDYFRAQLCHELHLGRIAGSPIIWLITVKYRYKGLQDHVLRHCSFKFRIS